MQEGRTIIEEGGRKKRLNHAIKKNENLMASKDESQNRLIPLKKKKTKKNKDYLRLCLA